MLNLLKIPVKSLSNIPPKIASLSVLSARWLRAIWCTKHYLAGKKWIILSTDGPNKEGEDRRDMAKKIDKYYHQGFECLSDKILINMYMKLNQIKCILDN